MKNRRRKSTQEQNHLKGTRHRHSESRRRRYQSVRRAEELLWREMQPILADFENVEEDKEAWLSFATHVMLESAALYDEPEFETLGFDPADALHVLVDKFNLYVPPPDELVEMPGEARHDVVSEARVHTIAEFIQPEFQRAALSALATCRRRLKREGQVKRLALTAATEWLLRSDSEPVIWGTCGIFHRLLQDSLDEAFAFEEGKDEAIRLAQAIQPGAENPYDLEEGSPAYQAFWDAIEDTPGLSRYLDRQFELEGDDFEALYQFDGELAAELLDPGEIKQFFEDMVAKLEAGNVNLSAPQFEQSAGMAILEECLPNLIKTWFSPDRLQEFIDDLEAILENGDEPDLKVQRVRMLYEVLSDRETPYWENIVFTQFLFNTLFTLMWGED